jgi:hypothetical protein
MKALPFSFHELNINNTKTIQNQKSFKKIKTSILTTLHSNHNFVQMEVSLKVTNTPLYINQKETSRETS